MGEQFLLTYTHKDKWTTQKDYCLEDATVSYARHKHFQKVLYLTRSYNTAETNLTFHNLSVSSIVRKFYSRFNFIPVAYAATSDIQSAHENGDSERLDAPTTNVKQNKTQIDKSEIRKAIFDEHGLTSKEVNWDSRANAPKVRGIEEKLKVTDEEVDEYIAKQSGFSRIRDVFFHRIEEEYHHDLSHLIWQSLVGGLGAGMIYGLRGRDMAEEQFRMSNKARIFRNKYEAAKAMSYARSIGVTKQSFSYFAKYFTVIFVYMGTAICIRTYNNRDKFSDYPLAGFISGGLWRSYYGAAAGLVGGLLGAVLSLGVAIVYYPVSQQPVFGMNQEIRHRAYTFKKLQDNKLYGLEGYGRSNTNSR